MRYRPLALVRRPTFISSTYNAMVKWNVHCVELQIYADSICKVALDDITL